MLQWSKSTDITPSLISLFFISRTRRQHAQCKAEGRDNYETVSKLYGDADIKVIPMPMPMRNYS
jgi:hypothetical protein